MLLVLGTALGLSLYQTLKSDLAFAHQEAERKLHLLATILSNELQAGRYQDTERLLREWGKTDTSIVQLELIAANGFTLGSYQRPHGGEASLALEVPISYSYRGQATLRLRANLAEIYQHNYLLFAAQIAIFAVLAGLLSVLVHIALQRRQEAQQLRQRSHELETIGRALAESEARLAFAIEGANDGLWDWNVQSSAMYYSPRWKALLGYAADELTDSFEMWEQRLHPEDKPQVLENLYAHFDNPARSYQPEFRMRHKNGTWVWIQARGRVVERDAAGKPLRMVGTHMDITYRKLTEILLSGEKNILEMMGEGAPLSAILEVITRNVEALSGDTLCSILLLDVDGVHLRHGAAPSLPEVYNRAVDGEAIGLSAGSCGTAAYRNQQVIVTDIATDPLWDDYRALALGHGLHACWSTPIHSTDGRVLGSFALYYREPRAPEPADFALIERVAHLTGIAIERKQTQDELRHNEERLQLIAAATNDVIWDWDLTRSTLWWNANFMQQFGYAAQEVELGIESWSGRIHSDDRERVLTGIHAVIDHNGQFWKDEYRFRRRDGSYAYIFDRGYVLRDPQARPVRMVGAMVDLSERHLAEEALFDANAFSENLIDTANVMVVVLDRNGCVTRLNQAAEAITGYTQAELLGKNWFAALVPKDRYPQVWAEFNRLMGGGLPRTFENPVLTRSGAERYIIWQNSEVVADGAVIGTISFGNDITERKQAEQALQQLTYELEQRVAERTAELAETNAELEAFSYSVSHDLRAPLRAVQGLAQALQEDYADKLDALGHEYAQRLITAAERMDGLILDLLAYSRLTRAQLKPEAVDLGVVVQYARDQLSADIKKYGATVKVKKPLPTVTAHPATLTQVLANLIANALKFVAPAVKPAIAIRAERNAGNVRLWVEDNGIGIEPEHQERIFRVFERLHGMETYPGTGIGLAIVRKGIERMDGAVGVESTLGQGSRFWIELPLGRRQND